MQKVVSQTAIEPTPRDSAAASVDFSLTPSPAQTIVTATTSPLRTHNQTTAVHHHTVDINDFRDKTLFMPRASVPTTRESIEFTHTTKQRHSPAKVSNGPSSSYHNTMASSSNHICFTDLPVDSRNYTAHYIQKGLSPKNTAGRHITVGDLLDQPGGLNETIASQSSGIQTYQKRTKQQQNYSFKKAK